MISKKAIVGSSPWPGPRPYELEYNKYFFGREEEIGEIRKRILTERLTILSGSSGTGKTSLIRSGVWADLLRSRERAQQVKGETPVWPIVILSDWGGVKGVKRESVDELFRTRLENNLFSNEKGKDSALKISAPDDYKLLSVAYSPEEKSQRTTFSDDIVRLCELAGGIILILDQFEEVLRAGGKFADEAVRIVETIYRFEHRARVLISLREEYHKDLHNLETHLGGLYGRTYFLKPMAAITALNVIKRSAIASGITLKDGIEEKIITWIRQAERDAEEETGTSLRETERKSTATEEKESIDLLTFQTILIELYEFCSKKTGSSKFIIDLASLEEYRHGRSITELVGEALERWISNALDIPAIPSVDPRPGIYDITPSELNGYVRRVATRLAPFLSSGDYKIPAEESDLLYSTLRDEFRLLNRGFENLPRKLWKVEIDGNLPRLNYKLLGLPEQYDEKTNYDLSGLSREKKWSPAKTASELIAVYYETQRRLQKGNILKPIRIEKDIVWELVHDKLGRPMSRFADKQKETWEDALFSLTAIRGKDILLRKSEQREKNAKNVLWQGNWIYMGGISSLEGFIFTDCNLQGTVFFKCVFEGGIFKHCIMDGALFINCQFKIGADGHPLTFDECEANGMAFLINNEDDAKSEVEGMKIINCDFSQIKMSKLTLNGPIIIGQESVLYLCDFSDLKRGDHNDERAKIIFQKGASIEYCAWDPATADLISNEHARQKATGEFERTRKGIRY